LRGNVFNSRAGFGESQRGSSTGAGLPTRIGTDTNWLAVAAGIDISLALKTDGTLWLWSPGNVLEQVGTDHDWGSP
jgi:trimeric autotransporter adhesin